MRTFLLLGLGWVAASCATGSAGRVPPPVGSTTEWLAFELHAQRLLPRPLLVPSYMHLRVPDEYLVSFEDVGVGRPTVDGLWITRDFSHMVSCARNGRARQATSVPDGSQYEFELQNESGERTGRFFVGSESGSSTLTAELQYFGAVEAGSDKTAIEYAVRGRLEATQLGPESVGADPTVAAALCAHEPKR